ncbi:tetratricopeptide repeat protein [Polluticoccus soli]|uniref:tetratricopeptide repeat protein n=1 Tax=Polluticoccus soli TaxID=3034150 RepID=UPI0023E299B8|nr:tetratricopeptide repeat protein [Flavipsychrobacter sp. JY13-12]
MRKRFIILNIVCLLATCAATAQVKKAVREGNKLYEQQKYKEAAAAYQRALQKDPNYTPGMFNLGNSLYKQKQFDATRKAMTATAKVAKEQPVKSAANYNVGNTYMEEQKWQEAVDAYKQALRTNPQDADAKYNLSYALAMMKKNGGGGGGGKDKNKQDKNDKGNKDKQDQDKNGDKKDEQDKQDKKDQQQDQKDQQDKEQDKQDKRPQPQPSKLSEQQAEQLLNALQQEEKKLQDKMQKGKATPVKVEKDW